MIGVQHNVGQLSPQLRRRAAAMPAALRAGLRRIGDKVERGMNRNLSGGGAPGSYPVPRRTGHLARSGGNRVGDREVVVFNSALYAGAIHEGFHPYGNPNAPRYPGRPFLADAAAAADPVAEIADQLERLP